MGYILLGYTLMYFIIPYVWGLGKRYDAMTVPDIFKGHYSHRGLELVAGITFLLFAIPWGQLQFQGLMVALNALGFNFSPTVLVLISGCIAFLYIIASGIKAPALISIIKDTLVMAAVIIAGIFVLTKMDGVSNLFTKADQSGAPLTIEGSKMMVFAVTTIIFQAIGFGLSPTLAIGAFTGKSAATVKKTQIFMPLYMLMYPFIIIATYYAVVARPNLNNPDSAFMSTVTSLMPQWIIGLVAAGAALSGILVLAVYGLAIGGAVTRNIFPQIPEKSQSNWVRIVVALFLLISILLTLFVPSLMLTVINVSYYGLTQFVPGLLGILFSRKMTPVGIATGILAGDLAAYIMLIAQVDFFGINIGLIALALNFVVTYAVSIFIKGNYKTKEPIVREIQKDKANQPSIPSENLSSN